MPCRTFHIQVPVTPLLLQGSRQRLRSGSHKRHFKHCDVTTHNLPDQTFLLRTHRFRCRRLRSQFGDPHGKVCTPRSRTHVSNQCRRTTASTSQTIHSRPRRRAAENITMQLLGRILLICNGLLLLLSACTATFTISCSTLIFSAVAMAIFYHWRKAPLPTWQRIISTLKPPQHELNDVCAICLEDFTDPIELPCHRRHVFCTGCFANIATRFAIARCPMCSVAICRSEGRHHVADPLMLTRIVRIGSEALCLASIVLASGVGVLRIHDRLFSAQDRWTCYSLIVAAIGCVQLPAPLRLTTRHQDSDRLLPLQIFILYTILANLIASIRLATEAPSPGYPHIITQILICPAALIILEKITRLGMKLRGQ